jgi:hypothetical protein
MGRVIWSMWGRLQGITSALALLVGGVIGLFYPLPFVGGYGVGFSILLCALEMPLSFLPKTPGVSSLFFGSTHLPRAFLYVVATPLLFFQAPTITGGICLGLTSLIYVTAVFKRESYLHPSDWTPGTTNSTKLNGQTDANGSKGLCSLCLTSGGNESCKACSSPVSGMEKLKSQSLSPGSPSAFDAYAASAPRTLEGQANRLASPVMEANGYAEPAEVDGDYDQGYGVAVPAAVATEATLTRSRNPMAMGGVGRNMKMMSPAQQPQQGYYAQPPSPSTRAYPRYQATRGPNQYGMSPPSPTGSGSPYQIHALR